MARKPKSVNGLPVSPIKPGRPDLSEIGQSGLAQYSGQVFEEKLRQLISPAVARATYAEMSQNDAIIRASLYAVDMLIRKTSWSVEPGGNDAIARQRADYLETIPQDMAHSWSDHISEVLTMLVYGWSLFEIVYKWRHGPNEDSHFDSRFNDGLVGVRKLAIRSQDSLERWAFDPAGGIQGLWQRPAPTFQLRYVPIEKSLLYRTALRKGNPEGVSLLRGMYRAWSFKKRIEDFEAIGIERELNGMPVAWVPSTWLATDASASEAGLLDAVKKIVRNIKMDEQAGIVMPLVIDENGNKMLNLELLSTNGRRAIDTTAVINRYNRMMAMSILADVILLGHEKVGSYGLATQKSTLFATALEAFLDSIADVLNRYLVPRLWRLNGWPLQDLPKFKHGAIEDVDLAALGDYIQKIAGAGAALFPSKDGRLENELLRLGNLPTPKIGDEVVQ